MAMHQHLLAAAIAAAAGATCAAALAPVCPSQQADTCFKDVGHAFPPVVGAAACRTACVSDHVWYQHCAAWTHMLAATSTVPHGRCHLKQTSTNETRCNGGVSGVVRANPCPLPPGSPSPAPPPAPPAPRGAKNILFMVDNDLQPEFNELYGQTVPHTPHMDKFAVSCANPLASEPTPHPNPSRQPHGPPWPLEGMHCVAHPMCCIEPCTPCVALRRAPYVLR